MPAAEQPRALNPLQQALLNEKTPLIESATGILSLLEITRTIIGDLLKRQADEPHRTNTQMAVTRYFMATMNAFGTPAGEKLTNLKVFATEIVTIVIADRHFIGKPEPEGSPAPPVVQGVSAAGRRLADRDPDALLASDPTRLKALEGLALTEDTDVAGIDGGLPDNAKATSVATVAPPPPQTCNDFPSLFSAAICYRVARVACFFQRYNPNVDRALARPFLLTGAFAERLYGVIRDIIVPQMLAKSRNITLLGTQNQWAGVNTVEFWDIVDRNERFKSAITAAWDAAWRSARLRRQSKVEADGKQREVLVAPPVLLEIRARLVPRAGEFTLPTVGDSEIALFTSMLTDVDLDRIEYTWTRLRQLYEQELDRRAYQDKARDGALRDSILNAFELVPDLTGDFLALLCYFCFPNCDLYFLERFTHNKGTGIPERRERIPYLMHFLSGDGVANAQRQETAVRQEREASQTAADRRP